MEIKNSSILMAVVLLIIGGLIGWFMASRQYNGPVAGLSGMRSSADMRCAQEAQNLEDALQQYQDRFGDRKLYRTGEEYSWVQAMQAELAECLNPEISGYYPDIGPLNE